MTALTARRPPTPLSGSIAVPGDKSISHRALMFAGLAVGETAISGLLEGEDVLRTAAAMRALGAEVTQDGPGRWRVSGRGLGGLVEPTDVLDMGNSGTAARLLCGVLASHDLFAVMTGDASLRGRPMRRVTVPLAACGAQFQSREGGRLPLAIRGAREALPIEYRLPVASAQVKSALLLAGLNARGWTTIEEPEPTRDHSERMLRHFGAEVQVEQAGAGRVIRLLGQPELRAADVVVPGDPSSAAFPLVAALLVPGSAVTVRGVGLNPGRTGLFATLREMGADLMVADERIEGGETVGDVTARYGPLRAVDVPPERAPSMIDEFPVLAVLAAFAAGRTRMRGLAELRVKESDRLAATAALLAANGVRVAIEGDDLLVEGGPVPGGAVVQTHMDHRLAMSALVLGQGAAAPVGIDDGAFMGGSFFTDFPSPLPPRVGLGGGSTRPVAPAVDLCGTVTPSAAPQTHPQPLPCREGGRALVIAIDGPASAGKGTLARRLAAALKLPHLDTGLLYRATARRVLDTGGEPADPEAAERAASTLAPEDLAHPGLRAPEIDRGASLVAAVPGVRAALLAFQRRVAAGGAVLDGRDIGTVVCPDAAVKLFVTADLGARARRRWLENGGQRSLAEVEADLRARDAQDSGRAVAPLRPAADAVVLDTSTLDADGVFARALEIVRSRVQSA